MADKPEIDGFLSGIDAKIAALQQLRESYLAAASVGAVGQPAVTDVSGIPTVMGAGAPATVVASNGPIELPTGVFRNLGLADAIRLYLSIAKRKQPIKEIATALREGGLASVASDFEQNVSGTLYRLKKTGELLQFKDGWDLAASYPENLRQRLAQAKDAPAAKSKRPGRKGKKKNGAGAVGKKADKNAPAPVSKPAAGAEKAPHGDPSLRAV